MHTHLVNHIQNPKLVSDSTLHVIGVISNPIRYHSRYRLYREWEKAMLATPHVNLITVETAFGDRFHEVTQADNPNHLQLRTHQELWHKENMINLGLRLLPRNWKYVAWVDCDVFFSDPNWALETIHQLQHYPVVQPWQSCLDLGFHGQVLQHFESFCYVHQLGVPKQCHPSQPYKYAHSGFAWAATRKFIENTKGLMEFPVLGSADHHMAWAMINGVEHSVHGKMSDSFKRLCKEWQAAAFRVTNGNLGFVKGRIEHKFHGPKKRRQYRERWQIFVDHNFCPDKDLRYDSQGLLQITGKPGLLRAIQGYLRYRHEDSIEEF